MCDIDRVTLVKELVLRGMRPLLKHSSLASLVI
jgi:hypothetical protein